MTMYGKSRRRSAKLLDVLVSLLRRMRHNLLQSIPLPVIVLALLQLFWLLFDREVTSQIFHPPPRPYIRPNKSSPLSPFYGPDYASSFPSPVRIFPTKEFPCDNLISETKLKNPGAPWKTGFLHVMQPHAAGITLAGITSRIARNVARRRYATIQEGSNRTACAAWTASLRARRLQSRVVEKSFLWSIIREPVDRMVSRFYHEVVSVIGKEASLANFQKFVDDEASSEYGSALRTLTMRALRRHLSPFGSPESFQRHIDEILKTYDFLGVLERLHESLAVLQLLLGLETQDMLYLSSQAGAFDGGASYKNAANFQTGTKKCIPLHKPKEVPLEFKELMHQPYMFEEVFEADAYLYRSINASLDATIESLGREKVDQAVKRLVWGQRQVDEQCSKSVIFPCSGGEGPPGKTDDCLSDGIGCGYKCLDSIDFSTLS